MNINGEKKDLCQKGQEQICICIFYKASSYKFLHFLKAVASKLTKVKTINQNILGSLINLC